MEEKREIGYMAPVRLKSERAWRTYHGGRLIDEMQGIPSAADTHFPEDWIMSTVRAINASPVADRTAPRKPASSSFVSSSPR